MSHLGKSIFSALWKVLLILFIGSIFYVVILKWLPVYVTPLVVVRSVSNIANPEYTTRKSWCPLKKISPELIKSVVASEDNRFFEHNGFDFEQIASAMKENITRKRERGASTISQQTAKNVFTFQTHTWIRKGIEAYFTMLIELIWGKERIMEVYLNVAELGNGVFGAESASRYYYCKKASKLTRHESCLLAAVLPSPRKRNPVKPGPFVSRRAFEISELINKLQYPSWVK